MSTNPQPKKARAKAPAENTEVKPEEVKQEQPTAKRQELPTEINGFRITHN